MKNKGKFHKMLNNKSKQINVLDCKERFYTTASVRRHEKCYKGSCKPRAPPAKCFFCGYGPSGNKFTDKNRLADHCLNFLCKDIMRTQWQSTDPQQKKDRIALQLPTEENVRKLISQGYSRLQTKVGLDKSYTFMPTLDAINLTREANGLSVLKPEEMPKQRLNTSAPSTSAPSTSAPSTSAPSASAAVNPAVNTRDSSTRGRKRVVLDSPEAVVSEPEMEVPQNLKTIRSDAVAFHRFFDEMPSLQENESSFVLQMNARTFEQDFPKQKKTQLHAIKITDPERLKGLKQTISHDSLMLPFDRCVKQIFSECNMQKEDLTLRFYDADGDECKEDCNIQTFLQRLDTHQPINVIDFFPPQDSSNCLFEPPRVIKDESLASKCEAALPMQYNVKKLEQYMLLSEEKAITPWHVDFSGTAVFYLLLKGTKEFLLVEPTAVNLQKYADYQAGKQ